jgi:hypothetical protein
MVSRRRPGLLVNGFDLHAKWGPGAPGNPDQAALDGPRPGLLVRTMVVFATGQSRFKTVQNIAVGKMKSSWGVAG